MSIRDSLLNRYWYVIAESHEVTTDHVIARQVLDEWLACYRDVNGQIVVVQDRCIHRCVRLSDGKMNKGELHCRYHGWVYGEQGRVVAIPSEKEINKQLSAKTYCSLEQDNYVYVCLEYDDKSPVRPFRLPRPKSKTWKHFRLQNRFENTLANCVENYIDVPHTTFVHLGIFRKPGAKEISATVKREGEHVSVDYYGEDANLGSFSWLLNPKKEKIWHQDNFYAPNNTSVHYHLPNGYQYYITSQSIPVSKMETLVYTDISYDFGFWTLFAKPIAKRQAQRVIDQDIDILKKQGEVIAKYGENFCTTSADIIHHFVGEIIHYLESSKDLNNLKNKTKEIKFLV